jgi:hypothetical protein
VLAYSLTTHWPHGTQDVLPPDVWVRRVSCVGCHLAAVLRRRGGHPASGGGAQLRLRTSPRAPAFALSRRQSRREWDDDVRAEMLWAQAWCFVNATQCRNSSTLFTRTSLYPATAELFYSYDTCIAHDDTSHVVRAILQPSRRQCFGHDQCCSYMRTERMA